MIVYRAQDRIVSAGSLQAELQALVRAADLGRSLHDLLIAYGELESAATDALMPEADGVSEETGVLRRCAIALGRLFSGDESAVSRVRDALQAVGRLPLPATLRTSVAEGYAFYGLYPEMYVDAARGYLSERSPRAVCVIGIRSIGASLSAVVAGTLEAAGVTVRSHTVRPHGHPFDRELVLRGDLRDEWRSLARTNDFLIVDEGPGLSGSSFTSVIRALRKLGVAAHRIVLFPSWPGDPSSFVNEAARAIWPRYRRYTGQFDNHFAGCEDVSAGRWREFVRAKSGAMLLSQPQHEARKYLGGGRLFKFAGLGRYGREKLPIAQALAEAAHSPRAIAFDRGFIEYDFAAGSPMSPRDAGPRFLSQAADYVAFRARHFAAVERSVSFETMTEMAEHNAGHPLPFLAQYRREFEDRPAVHVDGRMMPHEWIETESGWLKTDSVDHGRDHFYPGYSDPAWDLAALSVEFQLSADQRLFLLSRYNRSARDEISQGLLRFYEVAYLAFRSGYASLAAQATSGTPERDRFGALQLAYACFLRERIAAADPARQQVIA